VQLQRNFLRNFCHKFSATFGFFERNFLGGLFNQSIKIYLCNSFQLHALQFCCATLRTARYCRNATASFPSLCLSVCDDEVLWSHRLEYFENKFNSNMMDSLQREHPSILAGIGVGYGKIGSVHTKPTISPKRWEIERKVALTAYIKSYTGFRLPPKLMTLSDLWARFKVIDSVNTAKITKYCKCNFLWLRRHVLYLLGLRIHVPVPLLTYLRTQNNQYILCDWPLI